MSTIPIQNTGTMLWVLGRVNKSLPFKFQIDTGCSHNLISKEDYEILRIGGYLTDDDLIEADVYYSFGGMRAEPARFVNFKKLSFGGIHLKNVQYTVCPYYGGTTLLGMGTINAFGSNWLISGNQITINDDKNKKGTKFVSPKDRKKAVYKILDKLKEEVNDNGCKTLRL